MTKKTNVILGDGLTAYVIGAYLKSIGQDFTVYGNNKSKQVVKKYLRTDYEYDITTKEYKFNKLGDKYFEIFDIENKEEYLVPIKVGYMTADDYITYSPSKSAIKDYYNKQGRKKNKKLTRDEVQEYVAIDLNKLYDTLVKRFKDNHVVCELTRDTLDDFYNKGNINIFNTIFDTQCNNFKSTIEYIVFENNRGIIDYVYDCRYYTKIKRMTEEYTEYIEAPQKKNYITINNYYEQPAIYSTFNPKNGSILYDISRNATKTHLKIEDIISYLLSTVK